MKTGEVDMEDHPLCVGPVKKINNNIFAIVQSTVSDLLTLFLPGESGISPLIVYHVTKSVRNRVKENYVCHKKTYRSE